MHKEVTTIAEAASEIGVSPGALRLWEAQGLISVSRDDRGHRVFSKPDIERLRRISWWRRVGKLNHHAIRRMLSEEGESVQQAASTSPPQRVQHDDDVLDLTGAKLRRMRRSMGLTLSQLSEISGLSVSFISSFERGINTASPTSLARLSTAVEGHTVDAEAEGHAVHHLGSSAGVEVAPGIHYEWLSQRKGVMEPQFVTVEPGRGSEGKYQHAGEEFIAVLEGELLFTVQGEELHMPKGGTLHFDSQFEHSWSNPGATAVRVLWVTTERSVWRSNGESDRTQSEGGGHAHGKEVGQALKRKEGDG